MRDFQSRNHLFVQNARNQLPVSEYSYYTKFLAAVYSTGTHCDPITSFMTVTITILSMYTKVTTLQQLPPIDSCSGT